MKVLSDAAAERAVIAGIYKYGSSAYFDIADIVSERSFTIDSNSILFKCLKSIIENDNNSVIDIPSIYSAANQLSLEYLLRKPEEVKHLNAITLFPVNLENVRKFGATIRKLEIARLLHSQLEHAQDKILNITGIEPIAGILGIAEDAIFDFTSLLNTSDDEPKLLIDGASAYLRHLADNPVEQIGLSSGYPVYDKSIGGGFRRGTVSVIGARVKVGKSLLALNIGTHISKNINIPVLYLDTEMMSEDQLCRWTAMLTETDIDLIETGKYGQSHMTKTKVLLTMETLEDKKVPLHYKNITGRPFEEILSIIRRWIIKYVGMNDDGTAKDCLIIYDYLKLMNAEGLSENLQEYQLLGFMMTGMHNFAVRYKVPVLTFIQLNRDGITKEGTDAASGSDRIMWLCSNFSIYKRKSEEEIAEDPLLNGNRKLVPIISRHGAGLEDNDYINMFMIGKYGKIIEGKTKLEKPIYGFERTNDSDDDIPFDA